MIRTEIFMENTRLNLSKDLSAEFTYNIDDIQDFASRNTAFSKTIVLPGNAVNNQVFGHIFEFGSSNFYDPALPNVGYNFNAAKAAACVIYVDKIQIFKGVLRLLEIVLDNGTIEYECAVFGELGGFVSALGNYRIEELDFSEYDHQWNISNITGSWDQAGVNNTGIQGSGYYYPLIDYGKVSYNDKHDWDVKAFRPALYVKEYMDKIITGAGYTYDAPYFNSSVFRRLIIPQNAKALIKNTTEMVRASRTTNYTCVNIAFESNDDIQFENINMANFTQTGGSSFMYTGTSQVSTNVKVDIYGYLNINFTGMGTAYTTVRLNLYKGATIIATRDFQNTLNGSADIPFLWNQTIPVIISQNDVFRIEVTYNMALDPSLNFQSGTVDIYSGSRFNVDSLTTLVTEVNYNDTVSINANIPKGIFQRDFFASIIKMFNMYVVEDVNKKNHLIIKPYIDFYESGISLLEINDFNDVLKVDELDFLLLFSSGLSYLDWTYKVDRSKTIRLKPMSELNGRYFEYKYKSDTDYYNDQYQKKYSQGYADRIEDTGYDFAKDKQTAEIIFAATPLVGYAGEDKVLPSIFKLNNNVEDPTEHVIRIMQTKKVTDVSSYLIKNGSTTLATLTNYGYAGHLDDPDVPVADINFGSPQELYFTLATDYPSANLFNGYWADYIAEITDKDSKVMMCNVKLNDMDIYSLDFSKLIYIDQTLWRLNKVEDYNPMNYDTTKCEFLKVIELTYE
jgi:hypothetical protein